MKIKLTKEEYEKLPKDVKGEYKADGDVYTLNLEDEDGASLDSLKSAKDHEKKRRQDVEKKLKDLEKEKEALEEKIHELETSGESNKATTAELQKKFDEKLQKEVAKVQKEVAKRDAQIEKLFVDNVAGEIAGRISTTPKVLARVIRDRLSVEWDGDEIKTVVLDEDGKPSAFTVAELEKEIVSNKEFSGIIKGSQSSGSGASSGDGGKGGAFTLADYQNEDKSVNWTKVAEGTKSDPALLGKVKEAIGQA